MKKIALIVTSCFIMLGCANSALVASTATKFGLSANELTLLRKEAIKGSSGSAMKIGDYYSNVKNDFEESTFWYKLSAEQGNKDASLALAYNYAHILQQPDKAIYWYKSVGEYESNYVNYRLGELYRISDNNPEAIKSFCASYLVGGEHNPLMNLAELFEKEGDLVLSFASRILMGRSFSEGSYADKQNKEKISFLKEKLTSDEVKLSEEIARKNGVCN